MLTSHVIFALLINEGWRVVTNHSKLGFWLMDNLKCQEPYQLHSKLKRASFHTIIQHCIKKFKLLLMQNPVTNIVFIVAVVVNFRFLCFLWFPMYLSLETFWVLSCIYFIYFLNISLSFDKRYASSEVFSSTF